MPGQAPKSGRRFEMVSAQTPSLKAVRPTALLIPGPARSYDKSSRWGARRHQQNTFQFRAGGFSIRCRGRVMAAILIVEDETQVRVLSESYLQSQGHETLSAANIEQALAVLEAGREIDLLFTDIGLQGDAQAGLTLAQRATERRQKLKVLYTTGLAVTDGMKAMFVENAALLPKPYTVDQLQTTLTVNFGIKPLAAKL
jgi:CheY-like chemotaxis protein